MTYSKSTKKDKEKRRLNFLIKTCGILTDVSSDKRDKDCWSEYNKTFEWLAKNDTPLISISPTTLKSMESKFRMSAIEFESKCDQKAFDVFKRADISSKVIQKVISDQWKKGVKSI